MTNDINQLGNYRDSYDYALQQSKAGAKPDAIREELTSRGLSVSAANEIIVNARAEARGDTYSDSDAGGGGGMGWLVYIGILLFINLLLYIFDVGYIIY